MGISAEIIIRSRGWARRLIALSAGAFGALILAPFNAGPALVVPMVVAVWLLDGSGRGVGGWRRAFAAGWWLGFGYFLAGFWWLGAAFFLDPQFLWELPFGILGVPALLALFTGCGFILAWLFWRPDWSRILALAAGLGMTDWARGHLFTGFPWNSFGMALGGTLVPAQIASLVGLDGLNILAVGLCAAPATLVDRRGAHRDWRPTWTACAIMVAILGFGIFRLRDEHPGTVPDVVVRIVQPGLRPDEAFSYENRDAIVARYLALSDRDDPARHVTLADVTMLVWPESAFPFILTREPDQLSKIGRLLPPRTTLVTGAAREVDEPARDGEPPHNDYFNTMQVIGSGGRLLQSYDKVHLVPFGEYLPFGALLGRLGLRNFVAIPGGFEPGSTRHLLRIPGMPPAAPLICYEAIFPGEVMPNDGSGARVRPAFLLNITNDGWFGVTAGPEQHQRQARLRAIEEGLPMVRGAATGVSALIDPLGRIIDSLPLGSEGILDGPLSRPIAPPLAARYGAAGFWILTGMCLAAITLRARRRENAEVAGSGL